MTDYSDTYAQVETKKYGNLTARALLNDPAENNQLTRGGTTTFLLEIATESLIVESGESYTVESGTVEIYEEVQVDGTLTVNGTLIISGGDFERLKLYDRFAGSALIEETTDFEQTFRDRLPPDAEISTTVVRVDPVGLDGQTYPGVWGVIENIIDERSAALPNKRIGLELTVLAEEPEYSDFSGLETDLKA